MIGPTTHEMHIARLKANLQQKTLPALASLLETFLSYNDIEGAEIVEAEIARRQPIRD